LQFLNAYLVIELGRIAALYAGHLAFGERGFYAHYGGCFRSRVDRIVSEQLKHVGEVRPISLAQVLDLASSLK